MNVTLQKDRSGYVDVWLNHNTSLSARVSIRLGTGKTPEAALAIATENCERIRRGVLNVVLKLKKPRRKK